MEPTSGKPRAKRAQLGAPGRGKSIEAGPAREEAIGGEQTQRFRSLLEPDGTELRWTIARVPPGVVESWKGMRRLRVRGEIEGVTFRTSLFPNRDGRPGYFLLINKALQRAAGVLQGSMVAISLRPDVDERPSGLPAELLTAFEGDRRLRSWAGALPESARREIGKWIAGVTGEQTRARRAAQMAERLLQTMEGERVTPPVLEAMLCRSPQARAGWKAMTETQRRSHLLGIFYYQTPEARGRRAQKAFEASLRAGVRRTAEGKQGSSRLEKT